MNAKIMIVGLGDLGSVFLDLLLRIPETVEVVVATRNHERAGPRCNLAQLAAMAQGSLSPVRLVRLDLDDVAATARTIATERPEILLSTATMATWWLPDLLPPEDARAIRHAGFGVWLPVHLAPTLRLMRAAREACFKGFVLTAPYPDVVNCALGKVGLAPTSGIGNVAEIVPKLLRRTTATLDCRPEQVQISLVAHHALVSYAYRSATPQPGEALPPFLLRVEHQGQDISDQLDLRDFILAPEPLTGGRATHLLTASVTIPLIRALVQDIPIALHAPAPAGLPGGYPVTVSRAGVELALGSIPLADAIAANTAAHRFDGVDTVLDDGTVVLNPDNVAQLQSVLGPCAKRISISEVEDQATDLVRRYQAFAKKRGGFRMSKDGLQESTAAMTAGSKMVYERTRDVLIEGGSSSSRGPVNFEEYPIFIREGKGSRLIDVDGNEYIDWMMGFGALPLGHADPRVADAIAYAARTGAHFASATLIEVEVAEAVQRMVPNAERVRFANTGTEAVMAAVRLARGVTGRPKLLKFEGHYHGWYDDLLVSSNPMPVSALGFANDPVKIADSSGLNRHALDDTIVVPWNDIDALRRAVGNHPGQIAAIITEGIMSNMGVIGPESGYLEALQQLAREHGILFLLDETVTGFRVAPGGCQERFALDPDIVTFGKALGCGLPVAAFAGRARYMDALAWGGVLHYGTQNGSRIGMFAAQANLRALNENDGAVFRHIEAIATQLCDGLTDLLQKKRVPAIVQRVGPIFQIMFTRREAIRSYRDFCGDVDRIAYRQFVWKLFEYGVYMTPAATLHSVATAAHTEDDVAQTLEAAERALNELYR